MKFDSIVKSILLESKDYFGKEIVFKDEDTGKKMKGTIVDPDVVEEIETEECYGPHITDEWHGANEHTIGRNFDKENPAWYIVATGAWVTCPTQGEFHFVSAEEVDRAIMKLRLSPNTKDTFNDIIDEL
jgi:hypothetical protein